VGTLPHTLLRPIHALSIVALFVGASVVATTVTAATIVGQEALGMPPAIGIEILQVRHHARSDEAVIGLQPSLLTEGTWHLESYSSGGFLTPVLDNTVITAEFNLGGNLSGHASCNEYSGPYRAGEITISIGPVSMTRMACQQDVMDQEQYYLTALESAASYTVQATTLTLAEAGGQPVAIFGKGLLSTSTPRSESL
jgi:heat shock protein HslJ